MMNKSIENKIKKILDKNDITLKWCTATNNVFINNNKISRSALKTEPFFAAIKKSIKMEKDNDVLITVIE